MKLIIDIDEETYIKAQAGILGSFGEIIANGIPYEERPKGEWTDLSTDGRHTGWIACSVCGQEPPNESNLRTKFCPNCGAKMKGGTE